MTHCNLAQRSFSVYTLHLDNGGATTESPGSEKKTRSRAWVQSLKGILAAFMVVVCHIAGVTNVQLLERTIPDMELNVFRCVAILLFCLGWMLAKQKLPRLPLCDIPTMLLYGFLLTLDSVTTYIGFALIPAATAQCAANTVCLLSALLLFTLCGKEKFSFLKVLFVLSCMAGVILVIQPWRDSSVEQIHMCNKTSDTLYFSGQHTNCTKLVKTLCDFNVTCTNMSDVYGEDVYEVPDLCTHSDVNVSFFNQHVLCNRLISCWAEVSGKNRSHVKDCEQTDEIKAVLLLYEIPGEYIPATGICIAGTSGLAITLLSFVFKRYSCLNKNRCRALFWSFVFCFVISITLAVLLEELVWPDSVFDGVAVLVHCVASVLVWVFIVSSLLYISGNTFSIVYSTAVVFFLIPQYTILSSVLPGHRNWVEVLGVVMVLFGSFSASLQEIIRTETNSFQTANVDMVAYHNNKL